MSIRSRLEKAAFERDLKRAKKEFAKVTARAEKMRMPKTDRRGLWKLMLRAAGFKKIRLLERVR